MSFTALLVDDDLMVLQTIRSVFEKREFVVSTEVSAAQALSVLERQSFDLVVTDMRMETDTSGFEVVRRAKAHAHPPITVILSAFPIPAFDWHDAGADAMFVKGGGVSRILDDIEQLLHANVQSGPAA